jgi:trigger factor
MKTVVKKLPKSEVEIEGELESDIFEQYWDKALAKIGAGFELDGFRKGKVPKTVLETKVPEIKILEEMAELALSEHYPKIVAGETGSEKLDVIGRPEISITKLAKRNPLGFKIRTAILPKIKLPDYKKIAKNILAKLTGKDKNPEVTDEDVEKTILDIRKSRAEKKQMADVAKEGAEEQPQTPPDLPPPERLRRAGLSGEAGGLPPDKGEHKGVKAEAEENLPELNDEFVRALGPFESVADFRAKLKENIALEGANMAREKTRIKILEDIITSSETEVPEILVGVELDKILYKMESDVSAMGLKFEDYLKHLKKTKDDLRVEFRGDGEKKAKLGLILNEIAKVEKLVADEKEVEAEVKRILEYYKEADPERVRIHAENILVNELVFRLLESQ